MRHIRTLVAAAASLALAGCGSDMPESPIAAPNTGFDQVSPAQWERLGGRTLFFAHQSVGGNVLDGVSEVLRGHPALPLRVVEVADAAGVQGPGIHHKKVGVNGKPATKIAEFDGIVRAVFTDSATAGVAMLKFCYADMKPATDPDSLFAAYRQEVDALRAARPGIVIVHVTMPLWVDTGWIDHVGTIILGKATPIRALNAARHRYNTLLREAYLGREPFFDLAAFEATRPDGRPERHRYDGSWVPALAKEWSTDGGHLNEAARRRFAEAFLATLAALD